MTDNHPSRKRESVDPERRIRNPPHLPNEILTEVAKHLPGDDPVETARSATNFKLASQTARNAIEESKLGSFHRRVNRLGSLAKDVHEAILEGGVSQSYMEEEPISAVEQIHAVGPTLGLQTASRKSGLVKGVLAIPNPLNRADPLEAMAQYIDKLDPDDQTRVVDEATRMLKDEHATLSDRERNYVRSTVASALEIAETRLMPLNERQRNPVQSSSIDGTGKSISEQGEQYDASLGQLEERYRNAPSAAPEDSHDKQRQRLDHLRTVTTDLAPKYNEARELLKGLGRSRERSGRCA